MGRHNRTIDWITLLLFVVLSLFGVFLLLTTDTGLFTQQILFLLAGLVVFVICSRVHPILLTWFAPYAYVISCILLALSYVGPNIRGATRWFVVGGIQIQPSEFAKPLLLIFFSWLIVKYPPREKKYILAHLLLFAVPFLLVFKQPDLGTSIVYGGLWLGMMVAGGLSLWLIGFVVGLFAILTPWIWHVLAPYQQARITTFLNPALDPKGAGYNALQSTIAVGSGQLFGRGLGQGTQSHLRFLPEYHTDFIFATLVEELGFVGGLSLFIMYGLLLWRLILFAWKQTNQPVAYMYSFGLISMMLVQIFVNVGMNMGMLPITGITLPLVSYGGSSLLSFSMCFGLLMAFRHTDSEIESVAIA